MHEWFGGFYRVYKNSKRHSMFYDYDYCCCCIIRFTTILQTSRLKKDFKLSKKFGQQKWFQSVKRVQKRQTKKNKKKDNKIVVEWDGMGRISCDDPAQIVLKLVGLWVCHVFIRAAWHLIEIHSSLQVKQASEWVSERVVDWQFRFISSPSFGRLFAQVPLLGHPFQTKHSKFNLRNWIQS